MANILFTKISTFQIGNDFWFYSTRFQYKTILIFHNVPLQHSPGQDCQNINNNHERLSATTITHCGYKSMGLIPLSTPSWGIMHVSPARFNIINNNACLRPHFCHNNTVIYYNYGYPHRDVKGKRNFIIRNM